MDFSEALDALKEGRKVRSTAWAPHDYVFLDGSKASNGHGIDISFDFIDTQSEWELFPEAFAITNDDPNAPQWTKFSDSQPVSIPFWMYADGTVSLQFFQPRNYLYAAEDPDIAAWKYVEYPLPPQFKKSITLP